jgi:hypothetical protein
VPEPDKPKPKRARGKPKPEQPPESLDDILGGRHSLTYERYWKFVKIWPGDKNPAPKHTARAFVEACQKETPQRLCQAALNYQARFPESERRYMKNPLAWLTEEAWHNETTDLDNPEYKEFSHGA